jgi:GT2 family glycosyltransferase
MKHRDSPEAELETTQKALDRVKAELRATQRQLVSLLDLLEKQQVKLDAHESSIARLDRILMDILTGRVWRTLRWAGDLVKKVMPSRGAEDGDSNVPLSRKRSFLVCDEPHSKDFRPRSGRLKVRGWCLSEGGVDLVRVVVRGLPVLETKPSIGRPDVRKMHPDLDRTGRSGFSVEFDSLQLPNGVHPITISVISEGKVVRQAKVSMLIDHEKGFATEYDRWIKEFEAPDLELMDLKVSALESRPLISILMPVYNTKHDELKSAIESVINQSYSNWEFCVADDHSSDPEVGEILYGFASRDSRIRVVTRGERGGISKACNTAWQEARGEYVCFLDHDDMLAKHALAFVCEAIDRAPHADLLYSDEDKIDEQGRRYEPFFKPDWSPDLLLSENYICHLLVLRQDLASKIGFLNPDCDGSQDYDLILRASEQATAVEHIPKVLYHWRAGIQSTAVTIQNKSYALDAARRALEEHCERTGKGASVEPGLQVGRWRVRYNVPEGTRVSIIIAAGGKRDILKANIESIFEKTTYKNFEIVVIDNAKHDSIEKLINEFAPRGVRYIDWRNKPFNYSEINNTAARQCDSPALLFLNDDTSVIEPGWLEAMVELIARPEVGAVGAKLLYPDGRIQHAGVVMGLYDNCGHAFKGLDGSVSHYFDFSDVTRNVSSVTGACLMAKKDVFWEVGGFDENQFAVAFNDIDLCLKIDSRGYRVLFTPHALLCHYEAFSKTSKDLVPHPEEVTAMRLKWHEVITADPYYSPNLTRNDEDYSLRTRN